MTGTSKIHSGVLLGESLLTGAVLDHISFEVTKISRAAAGDVDAGQPHLWTFIEFQVAAEHAAQLADVLSGILNKDGGWYCDFHSNDEVFVVFSDRIFRYPRGDRVERAKVEEYGRLMGVPAAQLDWPV